MLGNAIVNLMFWCAAAGYLAGFLSGFVIFAP